MVGVYGYRFLNDEEVIKVMCLRQGPKSFSLMKLMNLGNTKLIEKKKSGFRAGIFSTLFWINELFSRF